MKSSYSLVFALILTVTVQAQKSLPIDALEKQVTVACIAGSAEGIQKASMELVSASAYGADKFEYASNLLASIEANGILFTGSKGDTYPVLILQYLKKMRTDVRVVHLDWLKDPVYFQKLKEAVGIESPDANGIRSLSNRMPVYVSLAAGREIVEELDFELYCTGLAFKCSTIPLANIRMMFGDWWKKCGKSYMSSGYGLNANYLVPMAMMADYANKNGYTSEFNELKQRYAEVAKSVGEKQQLPVLN
jgi:hypothetical protein